MQIDLKIDTHDTSGLKYAIIENEHFHRANAAAFTDEFKDNMNLFNLYYESISRLEEQGIV
jgi:hypothetical protein